MNKLLFKRIGIIVKSSAESDAKSFIEGILKNLGVSAIDCDSESKGNFDLLISIGGDGTILRSVRELKNFDVPVLGILSGTVGFLSELKLSEAETLIPSFLRGEGAIDERSILQVSVLRGGKSIFAGHALNEAVISQGSIARLMKLKSRVNGEELADYLADGLIISTPTGSTAHSLAAGGPIVHPSMKAVILNPINPYIFSQKPIVIPGECEIETEVKPSSKEYAEPETILTTDGQIHIKLSAGDRVVTALSNKTVKFLRRKNYSFLNSLGSKLRWL